MALLALGPFLHAHYGNSLLTGFHVDGISHAVSHLDTPLGALIPHVTSSSEEESAALGVTASHTRQSVETTDASQDDVHTVSFYLPFVLALFAVCQGHHLLARSGWRALQARQHVFAPGLPPLAHAPPLLSI